MPSSTRSRVLSLSEEADEEAVGTRSTRSKGGGAKLEGGLPPPRKKTKRAEDASSPTSAKSNRGRQDSTPSKGREAAASKLPADAEADNRDGEEAEDSSVAVCKICGKNEKDDPRPMITFDQLGTFHVFCGKIAAISSSNRMPECEIAEKHVLKHKHGVSTAVTIAFEKALTAVCESTGKVYVSVPDFQRHLAQFNTFLFSGNGAGLKHPPVARTATSNKNLTKRKQKKKTKGTHSDPIVEQAVANALMVRQSQQSLDPGCTSRSVVEVRRKTCVCGYSGCYSVLQRWVKVGDDKRCGYVSLPAWSAKDTNRGGLVNQFRELVFLNLRGDKNLAKEVAGKRNRKFVAFHHFERNQLLPGNKGLVEFIEPDVAAQLHLSPEYLIECGPNKGKYLPSPRRPWADMINELVSIEQRKSAPVPQNIPTQRQTGQGTLAFRPAQLDPADEQRLEKRLSEIPKDYESLKALYVETEKALAVERKRSRDIDIELSNTKFSMYQMQANQSQLKKLVGQMSSVVQKL